MLRREAPIRRGHGGFLASHDEEPQINMFRPESLGALRGAGFTIFELSGKCILDFGNRVSHSHLATWREDHAAILKQPSRMTQIAVDLNNLLLPDSCKPFKEQQKMVEEFSRKLSGRVPHVRAIVGGVADYVDLTMNARDSISGLRLFGERYGNLLTRTTTPLYKDLIAVGCYYSDDYGLTVVSYPPEEVGANRNVWIAPLIVPQ